MSATSRTGTISVTLLYINLNSANLGYKIYTGILKNHMQKTLDVIIIENESVANKNRITLHTFSTIRDVVDSHVKSCFNIFEFS